MTTFSDAFAQGFDLVTRIRQAREESAMNQLRAEAIRQQLQLQREAHELQKQQFDLSTSLTQQQIEESRARTESIKQEEARRQAAHSLDMLTRQTNLDALNVALDSAKATLFNTTYDNLVKMFGTSETPLDQNEVLTNLRTLFPNLDESQAGVLASLATSTINTNIKNNQTAKQVALAEFASNLSNNISNIANNFAAIFEHSDVSFGGFVDILKQALPDVPDNVIQAASLVAYHRTLSKFVEASDSAGTALLVEDFRNIVKTIEATQKEIASIEERLGQLQTSKSRAAQDEFGRLVARRQNLISEMNDLFARLDDIRQSEVSIWRSRVESLKGRGPNQPPRETPAATPEPTTTKVTKPSPSESENSQQTPSSQITFPISPILRAGLQNAYRQGGPETILELHKAIRSGTDLGIPIPPELANIVHSTRPQEFLKTILNNLTPTPPPEMPRRPVGARVDLH